MIFSIGNHVEMIIKGLKTQTRRSSDRYEVGKLYTVQPGRTKKGIAKGKIKIIYKKCERRNGNKFLTSPEDAKAEGGYSIREFEELYEKIHPNWDERFAYTFRFVPTRESASRG